jgi:hypothetical protein
VIAATRVVGVIALAVFLAGVVTMIVAADLSTLMLGITMVFSAVLVLCVVVIIFASVRR